MTGSADPAIEDEIRVHLASDLRRLLVAATTWSACRSRPDLGDEWPHGLVEMAEDSAFLHVRALCEKLTGKHWRGRLNLKSWPTSSMWDAYQEPINEKVMHLSPRRPYRRGQHHGDDLPDQVEALARAVLNLFDDFACRGELEPYISTLAVARSQAIGEADQTAVRLGVNPLFR